MMNKKLIEIAGAVILFLTLIGSASAQKVISFSGDILINNNGSITKARLYARGKYIRRVEMSKESGGEIFICPKDARGKVWVLYPAKKQYKILSWPETHKEPVSAWTDIQYKMEGGFTRLDTINGHPCAIYQFKYPHTDTISLKLWLAEDIHYVIKRVADAKIIVENNAAPENIKGTFQILNIKVEKLDDALFEIPSDYKEIK